MSLNVKFCVGAVAVSSVKTAFNINAKSRTFTPAVDFVQFGL